MRRSTAGCGPHSPTSACATPPQRSRRRPACRAVSSIVGPSPSGASKDEASQAEGCASPPTCAAPRTGGGVALPLAFAAAWLAYPGARLALPGRRDRHFGAPRQGARGHRGQVAGRARHRGGGAGAAPATADRPRRRSLPAPPVRPNPPRALIRPDAGGAASPAASLARRLARRRLENLTVSEAGGYGGSLHVGRDPRLSDNEPGSRFSWGAEHVVF